MAFRPSDWFLANKYLHIRSFLDPSLQSDAVPAETRRRVRRRLQSAMRLTRVRIGLFAIVYAGLLGAAGVAILQWLAEALGNPLFASAEAAVAMLVAIASLLAIVAGVGVLIVNRTLSLLEADIYLLAMEVVSRAVAAGDGQVPTTAQVHRRFDR